MVRPLGCLALALLAVAPSAALAESYRFTYRPAVVGEQTTQQAEVDLDLEKTIEQSQQVVDTERRRVIRKQRVRLVVLETHEGQTSKVRVTFEAADQSVAEEGQPAAAQPMPVRGKSYTVSRMNGELLVVNDQGHRPPPEELEIVASLTDTLGRPNPIAQFFNGRTIRVGERLELPPDMARKVLGLRENAAGESKFSLVLRRVQHVAGVPCAVFDTAFEARSNEDGAMRMQMKGQMVLEVNSCRAKSLSFAGPLAVTETHGPPGGTFNVHTRGTLTMANQATHAIKR